MIDTDMLALADRVLQSCRRRGWHLGTAESCTGGLIAGALTAVAGSSDVVEGGIVSYSNAVKIALLGVPADMLARVGAVSAEVARAMAEGVRHALPQVDCAVAVTGVAGPGGGSAEKPVGLVHFGLATALGSSSFQQTFDGDRAAIRRQTVIRALEAILSQADLS